MKSHTVALVLVLCGVAASHASAARYKAVRTISGVTGNFGRDGTALAVHGEREATLLVSGEEWIYPSPNPYSAAGPNKLVAERVSLERNGVETVVELRGGMPPEHSFVERLRQRRPQHVS